MADEILEQIQDCENRSEQLSYWEATFIQSLSEQYSRKNSISDKQEATLDRIWKKVTRFGGAVAKRGK